MKWKAPHGQADEMMRVAGYYPHKNGSHVGGFVFDVPPHRWHAKVNGDWISLHFDKTVHNFHNAKNDGTFIKAEHTRIIEEFRKIYPRPLRLYSLVAHNVGVIQKRKVVVRSIWNPMRYLKGKFVYY